jgi:GntR family transcriptional regulator
VSASETWDQHRPIYKQLVERIIGRIMSGRYAEGEYLPSVRQLADDFLVNPLTAARAYKEIEQYTETRRGVGVVVKEGVRALLLQREQKRFFREELPALRKRLAALEIEPAELMQELRRKP